MTVQCRSIHTNREQIQWLHTYWAQLTMQRLLNTRGSYSSATIDSTSCIYHTLMQHLNYDQNYHHKPVTSVWAHTITANSHHDRLQQHTQWRLGSWWTDGLTAVQWAQTWTDERRQLCLHVKVTLEQVLVNKSIFAKVTICFMAFSLSLYFLVISSLSLPALCLLHWPE